MTIIPGRIDISAAEGYQAESRKFIPILYYIFRSVVFQQLLPELRRKTRMREK
jgi:hypothetical protein